MKMQNTRFGMTNPKKPPFGKKPAAAKEEQIDKMMEKGGKKGAKAAVADKKFHKKFGPDEK